MNSGINKKSFSCWKISSHFSSQLNLAALRSSYTIGLVLSANWGTNMERAVRRPISCLTSFMFWGLHILVIVRHLSELASIPWWVSMKPKSFAPSTPNVHFSGLSLMFVRLRDSKTSSRSLVCWSIGLHHDVVHVDLQIPTDKTLEDLIHELLVGCVPAS